MNICEIKTTDVANGVGIRLTLFVSGCTNRCKGCFQPQTWDFNYGREYTQEDEEFILKELSRPFYNGITLLGGEPFEPQNQRVLVQLMRTVKEKCPDKTIWAFTGFVHDRDLVPGGRKHCEVTDEMLGMVDVLVDGPFVEEKKNLSLKFRGSENQRVIDMNKSREQKKIVLWCD